MPSLIVPGQAFPHPREADEDGLLAVTTELTADRIVEAYERGIFPWFEKRGLVAWFSPDPRMVLQPEGLHVARTLAKTLSRGTFQFRLDTAFREVVRACAKTPRKHERGTWIGPRFLDAYVELHRRGLAHSAEAWRDGRLAGGLYGVALGTVFFGESMFTTETDASKAAFATLVTQLGSWGYRMVDCQVYTEHLESLGAREWPRSRFLEALATAVVEPGHPGSWRLDSGISAPGAGSEGART
jgi:leucyl/phenylalanyl-tRNA--protein transferase